MIIAFLHLSRKADDRSTTLLVSLSGADDNIRLASTIGSTRRLCTAGYAYLSHRGCVRYSSGLCTTL